MIIRRLILGAALLVGCAASYDKARAASDAAADRLDAVVAAEKIRVEARAVAARDACAPSDDDCRRAATRRVYDDEAPTIAALRAAVQAQHATAEALK